MTYKAIKIEAPAYCLTPEKAASRMLDFLTGAQWERADGFEQWVRDNHDKQFCKDYDREVERLFNP
jgi:hypothetical protein